MKKDGEGATAAAPQASAKEVHLLALKVMRLTKPRLVRPPSPPAFGLLSVLTCTPRSEQVRTNPVPFEPADLGVSRAPLVLWFNSATL